MSLICANFDTLESRREQQTNRFVPRKLSCLHYLLPYKRGSSIIDRLRHTKTFKPLLINSYCTASVIIANTAVVNYIL